MNELAEMQVKVAFLERQIEDLDAVVRELGDVVSDLKRTVRDLEERSSPGEDGGTERPPHYDRL